MFVVQVVGSAAVGSESASVTGGVPKWVLFAVGITGAAALAYIIFGPSGSSDEGDKKKKKKPDIKKATPKKEPAPNFEKKVEEVSKDSLEYRIDQL